MHVSVSTLKYVIVPTQKRISESFGHIFKEFALVWMSTNRLAFVLFINL